MDARYPDLLAELADTAMALARDCAQKALAAEDLQQTVALGQAFERMARSVRLSIALAQKLERNDHISQGERTTRAVIAERKETVRSALRRSIRQEAEGETAERLEAALDLAIEEYALTAPFAVQPVIDIVDLIRQALRLPRDIDLKLPWSEDRRTECPVPS